jgi:hypothetical protein
LSLFSCPVSPSLLLLHCSTSWIAEHFDPCHIFMHNKWVDCNVYCILQCNLEIQHAMSHCRI